MTAQEFATQIRAFKARKPFIPFTIEYLDGREVLVDANHLPFAGGGYAMFTDRRGMIHFFDYTNVKRFVSAVPEAQP